MDAYNFGRSMQDRKSADGGGVAATVEPGATGRRIISPWNGELRSGMAESELASGELQLVLKKKTDELQERLDWMCVLPVGFLVLAVIVLVMAHAVKLDRVEISSHLSSLESNQKLTGEAVESLLAASSSRAIQLDRHAELLAELKRDNDDLRAAMQSPKRVALLLAQLLSTDPPSLADKSRSLTSHAPVTASLPPQKPVLPKLVTLEAAEPMTATSGASGAASGLGHLASTRASETGSWSATEIQCDVVGRAAPSPLPSPLKPEGSSVPRPSRVESHLRSYEIIADYRTQCVDLDGSPAAFLLLAGSDSPLRVGEWLSSCGSGFRTVLQKDRNLVTYRMSTDGGKIPDAWDGQLTGYSTWALNFAGRTLPADASDNDPYFHPDRSATYVKYEVGRDPAASNIQICQVSSVFGKPPQCSRYTALEIGLRYDQTCTDAYAAGFTHAIDRDCGAIRLNSYGFLTATPRLSLPPRRKISPRHAPA
jgi:hypothetical protein